MKVEKKQLAFLSILCMLKDKKEHSDKVKITVKGNKATFTIFSEYTVATTTIDVDSDSDIITVIPVKVLQDLIRGLKDDAVIEIAETGISFGKSVYGIEPVNSELLPEISDILDADSEPVAKIQLKDIIRAKDVSPYAGDKALNNIAYVRGHYISSDNESAIAFAKVDSEENHQIVFIPLNISALFSSLEKNTIDIDVHENTLSFDVEGIRIIIDRIDSKIPDIFESKHAEKLERKINLSVDKTELRSVISRMNYIISDKNKNAIYLSFKNNSIIIESRKYNVSKDIIDAEYDPSIEGVTIVLNSKTLQKSIDLLSGSVVKMGIPSDPELVNIKLTDETGIMNFYLILSEDS